MISAFYLGILIMVFFCIYFARQLFNSKKEVVTEKVKYVNSSLKNSYVCLDCEAIQTDNKYCHTCASKAMYPLGRWLANDNYNLPEEYYPER